MIPINSLIALIGLVALIFSIGWGIRILREYARAVIFRLGRSARAILNPGGQGHGPGLVLLVPLIDRMIRVSLRTVALEVPPQDVICPAARSRGILHSATGAQSGRCRNSVPTPKRY